MSDTLGKVVVLLHLVLGTESVERCGRMTGVLVDSVRWCALLHSVVGLSA